MKKLETVWVLVGFNGVFSIMLTAIFVVFFDFEPSWLALLPLVVWAGSCLFALFIWVNVTCIKELLKDRKGGKK